MTARAPTRRGVGVGAAPPRGWTPEVWRMRMALLAARERLPYASANARLLDGVERWVRIGGRGRAAAGPWWATAVALVAAAAAAVDPDTALVLAPWVGLVAYAAPAVAGATAWRPIGGA